MSTSTTTSSIGSSSTTAELTTTALQTTTTFLPILDDLLSPDFRPVTHPPIVTPLQTPTTCTSSSGGGGQASAQAPVVAKDPDDEQVDAAAAKIQKWWKKEGCGRGGKGVVGFEDEVLDAGLDEEAVKHSIRHSRTEEYIRHLESELSRVKSSLSAERKLRSLQFEAIRSLWSQVQKLTVNNNSCEQPPPSLMTQSCPNGLPQDTTKGPAAAAPPPPSQEPCTCTTEIATLKAKMEQEMTELKSMVGQLVKDSLRNKRPDTLDLGGGSNGGGSSTVKHGELQGYADNMARNVVEEAGGACAQKQEL